MTRVFLLNTKVKCLIFEPFLMHEKDGKEKVCYLSVMDSGRTRPCHECLFGPSVRQRIR